MENKLVEVIGQIGNLLLVSIDGKKFRAKVEGSVPSSMFLGEVFEDKGKLIVKVKEPLIISKSLDKVLSEIGIPKDRENFLVTKLLLELSVPIEGKVYSVFRDYNLPFLVLTLVLRSRKENKKFLFLLEKMFERNLQEDNKQKVSNSELEMFVNSFFLSPNERFKILNVSDSGERWYGYFRFDEGRVKKFVFTTSIEKLDIVVVFEEIKGSWRLELDFFGNVFVDRGSTESLKLKLEELGFKPISIEVKVLEVGNEKSSCS